MEDKDKTLNLLIRIQLCAVIVAMFAIISFCCGKTYNTFAANEITFAYNSDTEYITIANEDETLIFHIARSLYEATTSIVDNVTYDGSYYFGGSANFGTSTGNYGFLYNGSYRRFSSSGYFERGASWTGMSGIVVKTSSQVYMRDGVLREGWHIFEPTSYDGNLPMVELVYYGDTTSRNNTVFIPRFSLLTDPSSDVINSDGTWNNTYKVEYTMELYVASHSYANSVYQAYVDSGKDINNVRFQNALADILRADMPLAEATQTVNATIEPYSSVDFVTTPELLFYRPLSVYDLVSPINDTTATDRDKYTLAPYVYRVKSISARIKSGNRFGKSTVNAYSVKQSYLTTYTYAEEVNDDRNKAIEDSLSEAQDRYNELLYEYNRYVIDRQRLDAFSASESWYDIDIGKTAMQVIDIFDTMVGVVGSFADYTTMFMAWIPVSVLRLFIACLILNCIVSLYHALRG